MGKQNYAKLSPWRLYQVGMEISKFCNIVTMHIIPGQERGKGGGGFLNYATQLAWKLTNLPQK